MTRRIVIVGGETHIGEITQLAGRQLEIAGVLVRADQREQAERLFGAPLYADEETLYRQAAPQVAAIANENDAKAAAILAALEHECDAIVDKPLAIARAEQERVEAALRAHPRRRLLMLLTLRGQPLWAGMRRVVQSGQVGVPAFCHVRMAVQLKRAQRPPWFLDVRRSGGLFLDLLIHGLDQVEWVTGARVVALTATTGNLSDPADVQLRDHAAVFCELDNGGSAVVEGQRLMPASKGADYRMLVAGTHGYAELDMAAGTLLVTAAQAAAAPVTDLPPPCAVVADWLAGGQLVSQQDSLRANLLALLATEAAAARCRLEVPPP